MGRILASLVLAILLIGGGRGAWAAGAVHYTRAETSGPATGSYDAPPPTLTSAPTGPWRSIALPYVAARGIGPSRAIIQTWYRFRPRPGPSTDATYLYIPRWQTIGKIAIWADGRLIYAPRSGPVWNSFNMPVWVELAPPGGAPPRELLIRISSLRTAGGALSTVWIGDRAALAWRHDLRLFWQVNLTWLAGLALTVVGLVILVAALRRRDEPAFLLVFPIAILGLIHDLQFNVGYEAIWMPEDWFGWLIVNSLNWRVVLIFILAFQLIGVRYRRLEHLIWGVVILGSLVSLPILPVVKDLAVVTPLFYAATAAVVLAGTAAMWMACFKKPSLEGLLICLANSMNFPTGLHDIFLQRYRINIEAIYWTPYNTLGLMALFLYIILRRYMQALGEVEQSNTRLEARVLQRESELQASHERLRQIEQQQLLTLERQRLMRDMHDGMGSSLMGALTVVERGRPGEVDIAQMLRECIDDLKLTIDSLEPVDEDLLLLLATLRYRLEPRFRQAGIALHWEVGGVPHLAWLNPESALQVLRMVQEMFTNIVKHARASEVRVTTAVEDSVVVVAVEDNGVGFDAGAVRPGGRGLANLTHRAQTIGAAIAWTSAPGATRFALRLPR